MILLLFIFVVNKKLPYRVKKIRLGVDNYGAGYIIQVQVTTQGNFESEVSIIFPNLNAEMARKKMTIKSLAEETGMNYESLKNKMSGNTEFKRSEMLMVKAVFPNCSLDYLFEIEGGEWDSVFKLKK